jgi:ribosome recycling factor
MVEQLNEFIETAELEMSEAVDFLKRELSHLRAGKANPVLLDGVKVEYYGSMTPLSQMASVTAPDPRMLVITPWDKTTIPLIEKAILASGLGLNPSNDGIIVRVPLPILSEERRNELVKVAKEVVERGRVSVRNSRRTANDHIKKKVKDDSLPEDSRFEAEDVIQKLTDKHIEMIEEALKTKKKIFLRFKISMESGIKNLDDTIQHGPDLHAI